MSHTGPGQSGNFAWPPGNGSVWQQPRPSWQPITAAPRPPQYAPQYQGSAYPQAAYPPPPAQYPPPQPAPPQYQASGFQPGRYPTPGYQSPQYAPQPTWQPGGFPPPAPGQAPVPYYGQQPYPYSLGPWTAPRPPVAPKKRAWFGWVIFFVVVFLIIAPLVTSLVSGWQQPTPNPTYTPPTYTPPTYGPGDPIGTYTPGQPDLSPNEPPWPTSRDQIDQMLQNNPLYSQTLASVPCVITDIDLVHAPRDEVEEHMTQFVNCLMAAWYPPVTASGFELPHPSVTVYSEPMTTNCGEMETFNAYYCVADQQIYYAMDLIEAFPAHLQTMRFLAESIIAHEFGHAIQYRTMILMSAALLEDEAETEPDQWEWSRRQEMQADCFAGLFLGSVAQSNDLTQADHDRILEAFAALGGPTPYTDDHGAGTNRSYWTDIGLTSTSPGACSTFTANDELVG